MKTLTALIILLACLAEVHAMPIKTTGGTLSFTAIGKPGFLKIRGDSKPAGPVGSVEFTDSGLNGKFTFDLSTLDTGIEMRNQHMKEKYLEVGKFPKADLALTGLKVTPEELKTDFTKTFSGILSLHGVSKEVTGQFTWSAAKREVSAQFELKVSDFSIDVPKYLGVTVSEKVDVQVFAQLEK